MKIKVGSFTMGKVARVTDPCYDRTQGGVINNCFPGTWKAYVTKEKRGVTSLVAHHENYKFSLREKGWQDTGIVAGVDSGQCGIFDDTFYPEETGEWDGEIPFEEESFYGKCCELTIGEIDSFDAGLAKFTIDMYGEDFAKVYRGPNWKPDAVKVDKAKEALAKREAYPQAGVLPFGVVSSNWFGDGVFPVFVLIDTDYKTKEISTVAIMIKYY